jgi:predicted Zn-dependent protease
VRAVFDDLLAGRVTHFTLQGMPMVVSPRAAGFGAMTRDPWQFRFPHAIALMRTGDLAGAERELRTLVTSHPHFVMGLGNLAVVLGRQARFDEALGFALRARRQRPGDAYLVRLVATLHAGASLPRVPDARERALVHARVMLDLHAPAEARAALSSFGDEAPPPVVMLRARALVAEGDVTGALAIVTAARDRDPQRRGDWERVLAQLRERAKRSQGP